MVKSKLLTPVLTLVVGEKPRPERAMDALAADANCGVLAGVLFNSYAMTFPESPNAEQVEHLLRNAQLRDELEP